MNKLCGDEEFFVSFKLFFGKNLWKYYLIHK